MSQNEVRNRISPNAPTVSHLQAYSSESSSEMKEDRKKTIDPKCPTIPQSHHADLKEYSEIHTPGNSPESDTPGVIGS